LAPDLNTAARHLQSQFLPDVILLDVELPDGNGFEFLAKIRASKRTSALPVLMMSGVKMNVLDKVQGFEIGADDYIVKPFDYRELKSRIDRILRREEDKKKQIMSALSKPFTQEEPEQQAESEVNSEGSPPPTILPKLKKPKILTETSEIEENLEKIFAKQNDPLGKEFKFSPTSKQLKSDVLDLPVNWKESLFNFFLYPSDFLSEFKTKMDVKYPAVFLGSFAIFTGIQGGVAEKSFGYGFVCGVAWFLGSLAVSLLAAWLVQWGLGFGKNNKSFKSILCSFGLFFGPLSLAAFLGIIYVASTKGGVGDLTASPVLFFPSQSTATFLGFLLRRIDAFELWGLFLVAAGLAAVSGVSGKKMKLWVFGVWGLVVLGLGLMKGLG